MLTYQQNIESIKESLWYKKVAMSTSQNRPETSMGNTYLAEVYKDTRKFFETHAERFITLPSVMHRIGNKSDNASPLKEIFNCNIEVAAEDTFVMAERYARDGYKPLVLNFCSSINPGGGVVKGSRAQEEDLFRRSNYFQTLNRGNIRYPLLECAVYSPKVYIAKDTNYKWLKQGICVSCIAAAAPRRPETHTDAEGKRRFSCIEDKNLMLESIYTIFNIGILYGHDSLILGAWGCGAYYGPRDDIVDLFNEVLVARKNYFKKIGFGVLINNSNDQDNYEVFKSLEH